MSLAKETLLSMYAEAAKLAEIVRSGTVDLRTGELRPVQREDLITRPSPATQ